MLAPPGPWSFEEIEEAGCVYRACLSGSRSLHASLKLPKRLKSLLKIIKKNKRNMPSDGSDFGEGMGTRAPSSVDDEVFVTSLLGNTYDTVKITLTPIGREDLVMKLTALGRNRRNPSVAKEVMKALKRGKDTLVVSREAASFIKEELEHSLQILTDPSFNSDPTFAYQRKGVEHSLRSINPVLGHVVGPASVLLGWIVDAKCRAAEGSLDLSEVLSLVNATRNILHAEEGDSLEGGCVVKRDGKWRVIDKGTGTLWPQTFDSVEGANDAIASYQHLRAHAQ